MSRLRWIPADGRESGYTLAELLISTAIMVTVTGAIFGLLNPAQGSSQAQPEVADMQQRMRVGSDVLFKELVMAGAGPYQGAVTGSLIQFFAPILPRRVGDSADPTMGAGSFTTDKITLSYVPNSYSQTTIDQAMPPQSAELKVTYPPNCPAKELCGFEEGMKVIIFDTSGSGNFDTFVITNVQDNAGHLQHRGQDLNYSYGTGSIITQIISNTYWLDRTTNQLKQYDGGANDIPLVDDVVDLRFDYYGDPTPPKQPKPPTGVANCLYTAAGVPTLATLAPTDGSLAALTAAQLSDGPYCGSGDTAFDADLLRIRKVKVTLRMQAAKASLRGTNTTLFMKPGTAPGGARYIPDYSVSFDVSPRNLNLAR
jgi:hypothetical protein